MMQALAELAVMYPINGAFTMYICRFVDPSWGFACGWEYALSWLLVLPFEVSAAVNVSPRPILLRSNDRLTRLDYPFLA